MQIYFYCQLKIITIVGGGHLAGDKGLLEANRDVSVWHEIYFGELLFSLWESQYSAKASTQLCHSEYSTQLIGKKTDIL